MNRKLLSAALAAGLGLSLPAADLVWSVTTNETDHVVTIDVPGGSLTLTEPYGEETRKLIKTGTGVLYYQPSGETPYGALEIQKGNFVVRDARHVGIGPIVTASDGALLVRDTDAVLTNKVTFGGSAGRVAGFTDQSTTGAGSVTLTSVKSTQKSGGYNRIVVGRSSATGTARVCLSLTGEDTEPFDRLDVDGNTQVTLDDGTVQIPATAANPFIRRTVTGTDKTLVIGSHGVTLDTAEGVDVALGLSPTFTGALLATNSIEDVAIEKGGFEGTTTSSPMSGWTFTQKNEYNEESKRGGVNTGFVTGKDDVTWMTPYGDYYFHLRRGASLEREVTVDQAGLWRLSYWCGCRPPNASSSGYSQKITATVSIDDVVVQVVPALMSEGELHPFKEFVTDATWLEAGTHTIKVVHTGDGWSNGGKNYDNFVLQRCEATTVADGGLRKTGVGRLTIDGIAPTVPLTVGEGSLSLTGTTLGGAVSVEANAQLELSHPALTADASVSVANGGTLVLRDVTDNLVANGSFETPTTVNYTAKSPSSWTRSLTDDPLASHGNKDGAGLRSNDSASILAPEVAPDGTQVAYLRNYTKLVQAVTVETAGWYRLSYRQSVRTGGGLTASYTKLCLHARIDGEEILSAGPYPDEPNYGYKAFEKTVSLTAGEHELSFDVTGDTTTSGVMILLDDVRLEPYVGIGDMPAGELRLTRGSTLDLDFEGSIRVTNVFVDGQRVKGSDKTLAAAGVNVSGRGHLKAGEKTGMIIVVR